MPKTLTDEDKQTILNLSQQHPLNARADVRW